MRSTALPLILLLGAAACGQRGDLFLRDNPPPGYRPPSEVYEPVPYPEEVLPRPEERQK